MKPMTTSPGNTRTRKLTLIGLMSALLCILGPLSIPLPVSPVPITLTNFAVYIIVYILGMRSGTVSVLIYLCLGTAGLPVFSAFSGGLAKLGRPHRRIPGRISVSRADPGFSHGTFSRKECRRCDRHDAGPCHMLSLRHRMACGTDESYIFRRPRDRSPSISSGRRCKDHPGSGRRSQAARSRKPALTDFPPKLNSSHRELDPLSLQIHAHDLHIHDIPHADRFKRMLDIAVRDL